MNGSAWPTLSHCYCDLIDGQHQERRGGPSIGKAITLVEAKAKSRGTGAATLWEYWKTYKDVAHLVTAAVLICADARRGALNQPFGPSGLSLDQVRSTPNGHVDAGPGSCRRA